MPSRINIKSLHIWKKKEKKDLKPITPPAPDPVQEFYEKFKAMVLADMALLLELIQEPCRDVIVSKYGFYPRTVFTDSKGSHTQLNIQRILVRFSDGTHYTIALLPGFILPYRKYSLQLIISCLIRYYADEKISHICADTGIEEHVLREWIRLAEEDHCSEILKELCSRDDFKAEPVTFERFLKLSVSPLYSDKLTVLYVQFVPFRRRRWKAVFSQ